MELNVSYMIAKPEEAWREVKRVLRPGSVHVASYVATGHGYNDKKTMLNVTSRMNCTRSAFYVLCTLEQVSDIIAYAEEVCNIMSGFNYNVVAEHCTRTAQLRMLVELGPGLLNHKSHSVRSYRLPSDLALAHQERLIESTMRQEVCVLVGDESFHSLASVAKDEARYVVAFTSDNTEVVAVCRQKGISPKRKS